MKCFEWNLVIERMALYKEAKNSVAGRSERWTQVLCHAVKCNSLLHFMKRCVICIVYSMVMLGQLKIAKILPSQSVLAHHGVKVSWRSEQKVGAWNSARFNCDTHIHTLHLREALIYNKSQFSKVQRFYHFENIPIFFKLESGH